MKKKDYAFVAFMKIMTMLLFADNNENCDWRMNYLLNE